MTKASNDKLRSLLTGHGNNGPEEIDMSGYVSPVAKIKVIGVGGGGCNAVNAMIKAGLEGVDFVAVNTDAQHLFSALAPTKINIGKATTKGLGAGANPEMGKKAAEESSEEIKTVLEGADMIFVTCGLGGGTGTGATPVVASIARELGALVVGVITKPFGWEGQRRMRHALEGFDELKENVDTLITIPNDKVLSLIDKKTPLLDAFGIIDNILNEGVKGVSDLITQPGLVNVDFADVSSVMKDAGSALMGIGYGEGENRAVEAARQAIDSPLLELSIAGAKGILFNITGGTDLAMFEIDEAARIITESVDPDANIIFGTTVDDSYTGEAKITIVATGFDEDSNVNFTKKVGQATTTPFGKKGIVTSNTSATQTKTDDDSDVPAFIRHGLK